MMICINFFNFQKQNNGSEDLIIFDVEDTPVTKKTLVVSEDVKCGDSSPEY